MNVNYDIPSCFNKFIYFVPYKSRNLYKSKLEKAIENNKQDEIIKLIDIMLDMTFEFYISEEDVNLIKAMLDEINLKGYSFTIGNRTPKYKSFKIYKENDDDDSSTSEVLIEDLLKEGEEKDISHEEVLKMM